MPTCAPPRPGSDDLPSPANNQQPFEMKEPRRRAFTGAFHDCGLERAYRLEVMKPALERSMLAVCGATIAWIVVHDVLYAAMSAQYHGVAVWPALINLHNACAVLLVACLSHARGWSPRPLELWSTATLALGLVLSQLSQSACVHMQCAHHGAAAATCARGGSADHTSAALQYCARLALIAIFTPLQPLLVAVIAGCALGSAVFAEFALYELPPGARLLHAGLLLLVALLMTAARARLTQLERTHWFFRRSVDAAMARMHASVRDRASHEVCLASASAATDARSRLIRVAMHDLRSPLLSVLNLADTMGRLPHATTLGDVGVSAAISTLSQCATLMEHVVSDMLDFERIDSGKLKLTLAPFHACELLRAASGTFGVLAAEKGVTLLVEPLEDSLASEHVLFVGDIRRLQQCVHNGVSNALKFSSKGAAIRVSVRAAPHEREADGWQRLCVRVVDQGHGLTAEQLATLGQGEMVGAVGLGMLQGSGGTGLGLGITRMLLLMHHCSTLRLSSAGVGKGTTFEMLVNAPRAPEMPEGVHHHAAAAPAVVTASALSDDAAAPSPRTLTGHTKSPWQHAANSTPLRASSPLRSARVPCAAEAPRTPETRAAEQPSSLLVGPTPKSELCAAAPRTALDSENAVTPTLGSRQSSADSHSSHSSHRPSRRVSVSSSDLLSLSFASRSRQLSAEQSRRPSPTPHPAEQSRRPSLTTQPTGPSAEQSRRPSLTQNPGSWLPSADRARAKARSAGWTPDVAALKSLMEQSQKSHSSSAGNLLSRHEDGSAPGCGSEQQCATMQPAGAHAGVGPGTLPPTAVGAGAAAPTPPLTAGSVTDGSADDASDSAGACASPADGSSGGAQPPAPPLDESFCVLQVEDDKFLQLTLPLRIFAPLGCAHELASNGAEAVQMALGRDPPYAAILMDNQMPVMSGEAATRALRASGYTGLIIGMTGDPAGCADREAFEASGLDECVDKDTAGMDLVVQRITERAHSAALMSTPTRSSQWSDTSSSFHERDFSES